jgi:hypothetical protein
MPTRPQLAWLSVDAAKFLQIEELLVRGMKVFRINDVNMIAILRNENKNRLNMTLREY